MWCVSVHAHELLLTRLLSKMCLPLPLTPTTSLIDAVATYMHACSQRSTPATRSRCTRVRVLSVGGAILSLVLLATPLPKASSAPMLFSHHHRGKLTNGKVRFDLSVTKNKPFVFT
jgi:hypothetical protein